MSDALTPAEEAYFESGGETAPPAEPTPAPKPEPAPTPDPEPGEPAAAEPAQQQRTVPHAALHEERTKRQTAERELQAERAQAAAFREMLARVIPAQQQQQAPPEREFDIRQAPIEAIEQRFARQQAELDASRAFREQFEQRNQQQAALQELETWASQGEAAFREETKDYDAAAMHLLKSRDNELRALGVDDPVMRGQVLRNEATQIFANARAQNKNPAKSVYEAALNRGYTPPAPAAAPAPSNLDTVARGQQLSSGLGSTGSAPPSSATAEALLKMSDEEFSKATGPRGKYRDLMGG